MRGRAVSIFEGSIPKTANVWYSSPAATRSAGPHPGSSGSQRHTRLRFSTLRLGELIIGPDAAESVIVLSKGRWPTGRHRKAPSFVVVTIEKRDRDPRLRVPTVHARNPAIITLNAEARIAQKGKNE